MAKDYSYSPPDDGMNSAQENNNKVDNSQQGSFIEASFSTEDYSELISAETVQLESSSLPNYVDDITLPTIQNNENENLDGSREVQVDEIQLEEEEVNPNQLLDAKIRKQLILVHTICIVMAILSIGLIFLEIFPAVLVCLIYLRDDMNNRTAKYDRLLLSLTIANFVASLVSLFFNVVVIFVLCTFTFFLASILFVFIIPYTFIFRFVSRELLLNRGYSTSSNIYPYNVNNNYPASPYISPHLHPQHIQLHQLHHQHHAMNSFHPYPHHAAHHVAQHNHHHHHHSPHHPHHPGSHHPF